MIIDLKIDSNISRVPLIACWSIKLELPLQETLLAKLPRQIIQTDNTSLKTKSKIIKTVDIQILYESDQCIEVISDGWNCSRVTKLFLFSLKALELLTEQSVIVLPRGLIQVNGRTTPVALGTIFSREKAADASCCWPDFVQILSRSCEQALDHHLFPPSSHWSVIQDKSSLQEWYHSFDWKHRCANNACRCKIYPAAPCAPPL